MLTREKFNENKKKRLRELKDVKKVLDKNREALKQKAEDSIFERIAWDDERRELQNCTYKDYVALKSKTKKLEA